MKGIMKKILNLDMDGVLVDIQTLITSATGKQWASWDDIRCKLPNMFIDALPYPDATELVAGVVDYANINGYDIAILTAVPEETVFANAVHQKKEWLAAYFPKLHSVPFNAVYCPTEKRKHANKGCVLIDDSKTNIEQWSEAGGIAILHVDALSSLTALKSIN